MVQFIKHRINKISDLSLVNPEWGVEIDLRSDPLDPGSIYLHHDPWSLGSNLEDWLKRFNELKISGPIILNTKEDGLENSLIDKMKKHHIDNYFFLDTAFPTLINWTMKKNCKNFAVRVSTFESGEFAREHKEKVEWVWIDCFDCQAPSPEYIFQHFKDVKKCLVSPELQQYPIERITDFVGFAKECDAICTKVPEAWKELIN